MAQAKRIYILMFKVKKLIFFLALQHFLKEIENLFLVFLWHYRNTRKILGEILGCGNTCQLHVFPQHFSFSQTFSRFHLFSKFLHVITVQKDKNVNNTPHLQN